MYRGERQANVSSDAENRKSETKKRKKPHRSGFALDTLTERRDFKKKKKQKSLVRAHVYKNGNPPT
jgi:hypothetical protein